MKSEFDHMKGQTLEDMSNMVQQFHSKIANKKAALEPIVRELRSVRQQAQVIFEPFEIAGVQFCTGQILFTLP